MRSILRRALYLLRHDRALFAAKFRRRIHEKLARRRAIKAALTEARTNPTAAGEPSDVLSVIGSRIPVVVLERRPKYVCCAIRAEDVAKAVVVAHCCLPDVGLRDQGELIRLNLAELVRRCSRSPAFTLCTNAPGGPCLWRFEIFDCAEEGRFTSRRGSNRIAGILYGDAFDRPGVADLAIAMPELARPLNERAIDVVYTWVNHADPDWRQAFQSASTSRAGEDALSEARFYSNDELRYSLRSVYGNLPWARTIHIVSNCSPPAWLDSCHPRLRWVPHEAILPEDCLPTFNSHAIETSLHRVPDLAENFLYFNDDFLVFDMFAPSTFISENGTLRANLERQGVVNSPVDPLSPDYLNAARNSARLLFERFGYYPTRLHRHTPYSLSRSLLEQLESEFQSDFDRTRRTKFRSIRDINVASFLAHHYGFVKRDVVYSGYSSALVKSSDPFSVQRMKGLAGGSRRPRVVCVNEGGTPGPTRAWRREAAAFMAKVFPERAPWERVPSA